MCGITGFTGENSEQLLKEMCNSLAHRGPDDAGYFHNKHVGLSMRRLAIIDLKTGNQPIANENKDVWVVFNGEIYNYEDLREKLIKRGHVFSTNSDTETIVHLYEDYGVEFLKHLRGMFGIALWETRKKRLILARDRIGEKPLYYCMSNNKLYFGSEIKSILKANVKRELNPQAVCEYLSLGYLSGNKTFYKGIKKIEPGQIVVWQNNDISVEKYWKFSSESKPIAYENAAEALKNKIDETVRLCLKSDVEVGGFLSGGIDSSVITALMKMNDANVQTFCVGYKGQAEGFNELQYAKYVAKHIGTIHHELILDAKSSIDLLPKILWHYDEPHGEPTSVLVYLLCQFTRKYVKVALGGTGGDEIFYGYPKHAGLKMLQIYRLFPKFIRKNVVEKIASKWPESTKGSRFAKRAKRFISGSEMPPEDAYMTWVSLLNKDIRENLISDALKETTSNFIGEEFLKEKLTSTSNGDLLNQITSIDICGYLPEYQLTYMDRMSMAHGLEVRSPLCDYELVEYVTNLPAKYRLRGIQSKYIFKDIARHWIPSKIAHRKKVGFDSPIGQWIKTELKSFVLEFLSQNNIVQSNILDPVAVKNLLNDHISGNKDYSLPLWSIIALEGWYRMFIEDAKFTDPDISLNDIRGGTIKV